MKIYEDVQYKIDCIFSGETVPVLKSEIAAVVECFKKDELNIKKSKHGAKFQVSMKNEKSEWEGMFE
jgi:hypothetical protein